MTLGWIAGRLHKAVPGHVACLLYRKSQDEQESENKPFSPRFGRGHRPSQPLVNYEGRMATFNSVRAEDNSG